MTAKIVLDVAAGRMVDDLPFRFYDGREALNADGCKKIIDRCEAYYWHHSPRNPDYKAQQSRTLDLGKAAHFALLQIKLFNASVSVIDAADYRTNKAKEERQAAYDAGKTPLLEAEFDTILEMRKALERHPIAKSAFMDEGGSFERSLFWDDPHTGISCKARPDFLAGDFHYVADPKTTTNAHPKFQMRQVKEMGHHRRIAWYQDGVRALTGRLPVYWYVSIEREAPHLISVWTLPQRWIEIGRIENRKAAELYKRAIDTGDWPGYRDLATPNVYQAFTLEMPNWIEYDFAADLERGRFRLAEELQAPLALPSGTVVGAVHVPGTPEGGG